MAAVKRLDGAVFRESRRGWGVLSSGHRKCSSEVVHDRSKGFASYWTRTSWTRNGSGSCVQGLFGSRSATWHDVQRKVMMRSLSVQRYYDQVRRLEADFQGVTLPYVEGSGRCYPLVLQYLKKCVDRKSADDLTTVLNQVAAFKDRQLASYVRTHVANSFIEVGAYEKSWQVITTELQTKSEIPLTTTFFNIAFKLCLRAHQFNDIVPLLAEMSKRRIPPNDKTFAQIVDSFTKLGQSERALQLVKTSMIPLEIQPNEFLWSSLILGFSREGNLARVKEIDAMSHVRDEPFIRSVLRAYLDLQAFDDVERVVEEARSRNCDIDHLVCVLMTEYGLVGNVKAAEAHFKHLTGVRKVKGTRKVLMRAHNSLMFAYSKTGAFEKLDALFEEMKQRGPSPDERIFHIMMNSYMDRGDPEEVTRLLEQLKKFGLRPDIYTAERMLRYAGMIKSKEALDTWYEFAKRVCDPLPGKVEQIYRFGLEEMAKSDESAEPLSNQEEELAKAIERFTNEKNKIGLMSMWASVQEDRIQSQKSGRRGRIQTLKEFREAFISLNCAPELEEVQELLQRMEPTTEQQTQA